MAELRVAFFPSYPPEFFEGGGGALAIWKTALSLAKRPGLDVKVISPDSGQSKFDAFDEVDLIHLKNAESKSIYSVLNEIDADIVHGFRASFLPGIEWARHKGVPSVYEVRLPDYRSSRLFRDLKWPISRGWSSRLLGRRERLVSRKADCVVVPSKSALKDLRLYFGISSNRSWYAYNGISYDTFYPEMYERSAENGLRLVNAGRITEGKNFDMVVNVYKRLLNEFPQLSLDLVGEGNERVALQARCSREQLHRVIFHGSVPHETLASLYRKADVLLNASRMESFGNVVGEAMACGLPIVCFRVGSLPELVDHGHNGYLCAYADQDDLYTRTRELLQDAEKRQLFGRAAADGVREKFSWDLRAYQLEKIYHRLLGKTVGSFNQDV